MEDKNILPYNMNEKFENKSVSCIVRVDMCSYEKDPFTTQHTHMELGMFEEETSTDISSSYCADLQQEMAAHSVPLMHPGHSENAPWSRFMKRSSQQLATHWQG